MSNQLVQEGFFDVQKYETSRHEDEFDFSNIGVIPQRRYLHITYSFPAGVTMQKTGLSELVMNGTIDDFELQPAFGINGISETLTIRVKI
jgi:hypothetical protein